MLKNVIKRVLQYQKEEICKEIMGGGNEWYKKNKLLQELQLNHLNALNKKIDLLQTQIDLLELKKTKEQITSQLTEIRKFQDWRIWLAEKRLKSEFFNLHFYLEKAGMISSVENCEDFIYNLYFYDNNRYYSFMSAKEVFKILLPSIKPSSIIDFGCGTGSWLYAAKSYGVKKILGIDGDYVPKNMLMIQDNEFKAANLQEKIDLEEKFDLVII